ncbi:MAG: CPBP family intramembrane metalloprotease [Verrucomicrobia bacterium]|nr:CPBP family intramembrane metalloprotease [Verrucomicrobiota bacterium]
MAEKPAFQFLPPENAPSPGERAEAARREQLPLWPPEPLISFLGWLFLSIALASLLRLGVETFFKAENKAASGTLGTLSGTLAFHLLVLGGIFRALRSARLSWSQAFGDWRRRFGRTTLLGCLLGVFLIGVNIPLMLLVRTTLESLSVPVHVQEAIQIVQTAPSLSAKIAIGFMAVLAAPVMEELLFRGVLYAGLRDAGHPQKALWGSAILFALSHSNTLTFLPLTVFGVIQALAFERFRNLWPCIAAHALFNLFNFTMALQAASGS